MEFDRHQPVSPSLGFKTDGCIMLCPKNGLLLSKLPVFSQRLHITLFNVQQ